MIPTPNRLGQPVPDSPHAVCLHLPQLRDVIGYEEKDPRVLDAITTGYPRFVLHPFIVKLAEGLRCEHGLDGRLLALLPSRRAVTELQNFLVGVESEHLNLGGFHLVHLPHCPENRSQVRAFLQHTGYSISSRQAEDLLIERGQQMDRFPEDYATEGASERVRRTLAEIYRVGRSDAVLLCNSGMNAFYSVFRAIQGWAAESERTVWIQFGWLYLDTARILERFQDGVGRVKVFYDVFDEEALEAFLAREGHRVAACITEVPTNPLLQTANLKWLRRLADHHGFALVIDPSMASACNVEVMPHADVVVQSLSKYTASVGDVIMGAVIFNRKSEISTELLANTVPYHEPPYSRDLARLALEMEDTPRVIKTVNATAALVASWLESHPRVRHLFWAYRRGSRSHYETICRRPIGPGSVLSFEVEGSMEAFYNACPLVKGPSFGTVFSILCPYLYLAHYDLVSTEEGRRHLNEAGLSPDLLRLSVGLEKPADIIAALEQGFAAL